MQWKETEFIAKGSMPPLRREPFGQDEASHPTTNEPQPPTDVSLDCTQTVLVNGDMLRIDREGTYWHPHRGLQQDFKVDTFDGEVSKTFYDERTTHELDGFIQREARNHEYDCYLYWPIALAFRPCDPDMGGLNLKLCKINPSLETVDGRTCVVLVASNRTLWLDPLRDFNVLKLGDEARSWSCNISYQEDRSHVWVPVEWKTVFIWPRDSKPRQQTVAKVTDCKLNADPPRSAFQFEFPVGTYVSDSRKEPIERYIVRARREDTVDYKGRVGSRRGSRLPRVAAYRKRHGTGQTESTQGQVARGERIARQRLEHDVERYAGQAARAERNDVPGAGRYCRLSLSCKTTATSRSSATGFGTSFASRPTTATTTGSASP